MGNGREFGARESRTLQVCYGSPASVRAVTGDDGLLRELETALFTAAALAQEEPHDCTPFFWLEWVSLRSFDTSTGEDLGYSGGGGVCPCAEASACPLEMNRPPSSHMS